MNSDLLIELGCEDLPARFVAPLAEALANGFSSGLEKRGIALGAKTRYCTPRRIAVLIAGVAERQPDQTVERKGPQVAAAFKEGNPTPAALGFAKSCGVEIDALKQENGYLVFRSKRKGSKTLELIPEIFTETLKQMDELVPKRMRWGSADETFVRPVRWLLALFGSRVVPLSRFGMTAGRKTYGHRFHAPAAISLKTPADYLERLREAKVWADFQTRRSEIHRQVEEEARRLGGRARITEELLDEVTALVEWPVVISGRIEDRFLQLPPEVIVSTVETNQRYFTLFSDAASVPGQMRSASGYLKPLFITVANIESHNVGEVIAGNERVVRPRLTDALFFWDQDRKQPLEAYGTKLASVTFQKDLGSIADKVARIGQLAVNIGGARGEEADQAARAAQLCKNDLVTRVVYEYPELQGLMGGYYARASKEHDSVAQAIAEHYRPTQAGGAIPSTRTGQIIALADKLDTLAGIFRIGQKPTASKDPFGLRRAALGALRICIEGELDLDLRKALHRAWELQPVPERSDSTFEDALNFLVERLRGYCIDRGASVEQFEAVRAIGASNPLDFMKRLDALKSFMTSPAAATLAAADKRARNLLKQAGEITVGVNGDLLREPADQALFHELERVESALDPLRTRRSYYSMLRELAVLKEPVDQFFNDVMVMVEDLPLRTNRLAMLARLDALCRDVADLSCLPG
jgi:glycyl-tRNA synthetase beta chain